MTNSAMFDDEVLSAFIHGFFGYGNYEADYWFVGIEEGLSEKEGNGVFRAIQARIDYWYRTERKALTGLVKDHTERSINEDYFFGQNARLQPTWKKLIRVLLRAEGKDVSIDTVRDFQRKNLGRDDGNNAILELLPIPCHSTAHWFDRVCSELDHFDTKFAYQQHYSGVRAKLIREQVEKYKPKAIVFYSSDQQYRKHWDEIAQVRFSKVVVSETPKRLFEIGHDGQTVFVIMQHPTGFGTSNAYCDAVGNAIKAKTAELSRNREMDHTVTEQANAST